MTKEEYLKKFKYYEDKLLEILNEEDENNKLWDNNKITFEEFMKLKRKISSKKLYNKRCIKEIVNKMVADDNIYIRTNCIGGDFSILNDMEFEYNPPRALLPPPTIRAFKLDRNHPYLYDFLNERAIDINCKEEKDFLQYMNGERASGDFYIYISLLKRTSSFSKDFLMISYGHISFYDCGERYFPHNYKIYEFIKFFKTSDELIKFTRDIFRDITENYLTEEVFHSHVDLFKEKLLSESWIKALFETIPKDFKFENNSSRPSISMDTILTKSELESIYDAIKNNKINLT